MTEQPSISSAQYVLRTDQKIVVFGGYGVFGRHVSEELVRRGHAVTIAGRDRERARQLSERLGPRHHSVQADVSSTDSCVKALQGHHVAINCTGPFSAECLTLLDACISVGVHHIDIADNRGYVEQVMRRHDVLQQRGVVAAVGCSSLPGLSGCLVGDALPRMRSPIATIRVTLFIGSDNPKGYAAVKSAAGQLGTRFETPQGNLRAFRDPESIDLPSALGRPIGLNFNSPEYDIFPQRFRASSVTVKVAFESRLVSALFLATSRIAPTLGRSILPWTARLASSFRLFGTRAGAVKAAITDIDGNSAWTTVWSAEHGQRLAIMPCVYAVEHLLDNRHSGATTAYDLCGSDSLISRLAQDGYSFDRNES
ncbi:MAG: saccharopine dehydrogenase NADP-binding domain-containing protein [Planctomycetota bacterium]|nr:saccharopine dehydrogenase NADP-binding domain-containing protein [Planctomycetota bacterium]MDA1179845.1 saccharopine dehydrogenase NADP-binding domain-containing protein [Planctomycetota bacterium]